MNGCENSNKEVLESELLFGQRQVELKHDQFCLSSNYCDKALAKDKLGRKGFILSLNLGFIVGES